VIHLAYGQIFHTFSVRNTEKLHDEKLNNLYSSPHFAKMIKSRGVYVERVARKGKSGNIYRILDVKYQRTGFVGRHGRESENIIKTDLR